MVYGMVESWRIPNRNGIRHLCVFVVICVGLCWAGCGWSDDGSVEQPTRFTGSGTYGQVADEKEKGDVILIVFKVGGLLY